MGGHAMNIEDKEKRVRISKLVNVLPDFESVHDQRISKMKFIRTNLISIL
jgi:hypothetical protein